mmetsp:Transcript_28441/g.31061  ORF Transcript_28441/g.31061 Transcript_28441/m.31061 type:complete len:300 (-) Transcript_28441:103-1002(-)
MTTLPPAFKSLLSAFKRADELDRDTQRENRIVAYHIRYWGVTKAAKLMSKDPEEQKFIASQLDLLEKISPQLHIGEGEGKTICIQQATLLFDRADEIDRAGFADKATAKLFYTAATIYDSLEQFGEQDNEIIERKKYAKWKAADIVNSINAGLKPTPGGFGEQSEADNGTSSFDIPAAPSTAPQTSPYPSLSAPIQPFSPPAPVSYQPPSQPQPTYQQPVHQPIVPAQQPRPLQPVMQPPQPQNYVFPTATIPRGPPQSPADPRVKDTIELAQFAISALNHNNIQLARDRLQEALRRLG